MGQGHREWLPPRGGRDNSGDRKNPASIHFNTFGGKPGVMAQDIQR